MDASHLTDPAAEEAILSLLLTSETALDDVVEHLAPTDFSSPHAIALFEAVLSADAAGRSIDTITLADELRRRKTLTRVGGPEALSRLASLNPQGSLASWVEIVSERSALRRLLTASRTISSAVLDPAVLPADAREIAEKAIFDLSSSGEKTGAVSMTDAVAAALKAIEDAQGKSLLGASTGLVDLDRLTSGLRGGQLVVLAARPGIGKSALATQIARTVAEGTGRPSRLYSYEMSATELTLRLLASGARMDLQALQSGRLAPGQDRALAKEAESLTALPLDIVDRPPTTITGLRSELRRAARRGPLGLVVVDYIQLLGGEGKFRDGNRTQEVSEVTRGLKLLAMDLDVPVLALSQLNRAVEMRPNKRPQLSDLRDSGSVEQDADTVWFLYRESEYNESAPKEEAELIVAKQRSGPQGTVYLSFAPTYARFGDRVGGAPAYAPPAPSASFSSAPRGRGGYVPF